MPQPLSICIVTGSRAEYGLLRPLMDVIKKDRRLRLQLLVTGMHLSPEFGLTYQQIEADGFTIDEKVEMLLSADTGTSIAKATGLGMIGFADAFQRLNPDWVVVLGDRFETFAAATAAHLARLPIAHLHGGEITEGATDDAMRHAITKMSYLHFVSAPEYKKRVAQLGEDPKRVFHVGAIGMDAIDRLKLLSKKQLEKELDFRFDKPTALVTYHPVTLENNTALHQVNELLKALDSFPGLNIIFTLPNADANGRIIISRLLEYVNKHPQRVRAFTSLGQLKYLSSLQQVNLVIGNSSSGIIEVPEYKIPTINIGDRQQGRVQAGSIINTGTNAASVRKAIVQALDPAFRKKCLSVKNPYRGKQPVAKSIVEQLLKAGKLQNLKKKFYDIKP
jgi:GDP/UDP-N,N'-diacetylbacillosamine 2-epimerase (hydrolysing)